MALRRMFVAVATVIAAVCTAARGAETVWTNAAFNRLWSDPINWSNGIPDATKIAVIPSNSSYTIDLGGVPRSALELHHAGQATFINGHLDTNRIVGDSGIYNVTLGAIGPLLDLGENNSPSYRANIGDGQGGGEFALVFNGLFSVSATHSGSTIIPSALQMTNAATITRSSSINITGTEMLIRNTTPGANPNRLPDTAPLRLRLGRFRLESTIGAPGVENIGTIEMFAGHSSLEVGVIFGGFEPPLTQTLAAPALVRQRFATLTLDVYLDNSTQVHLLSAPAMSGGGASGTQLPVLPYATGKFRYSQSGQSLTRWSFITYDPGPTAAPTDDIGLRPLDVRTEYANTIEPGASLHNVRITDSRSLSSDATINALIVHNGRITLNNASLTFSSGGLLVSGNASFTAASGAGRLIFPDEALIGVQLEADVRAHIDVPIQANDLVIHGTSDAQAVVLNRPSIQAGGIHVSGAALGSGTQGAIGGGAINLDNGVLLFTSVNQTYATPIFINESSESSGMPPSVNGQSGIDIDGGLEATLTGPLNAFASTFFKRGLGSLRLEGSYFAKAAGKVQIRDGTLTLNSVASTSVGSMLEMDFRRIELQGVGTLAGNGTFLGTVRGGRIAPGDGVGRLTIDRLVADLLDQATAMIFELRGLVPGVSYDQLVTLSSATIDHQLLLVCDFSPAFGSTMLIMDNRFGGALPSRFDGLPQNAVVTASNGTQFRISYTAGSGNDVVLTAIPEPSTFFTGLSLITTSCWRPRRRFCSGIK